MSQENKAAHDPACNWCRLPPWLIPFKPHLEVTVPGWSVDELIREHEWLMRAPATEPAARAFADLRAQVRLLYHLRQYGLIATDPRPGYDPASGFEGQDAKALPASRRAG